MKIDVIAKVLCIINYTMKYARRIIHIYKINLIDTRKLGNYLLIKYIKK